MKYKNKRIWQRITALLLTVILVSTSTSVLEVLAATMDSEPTNTKAPVTGQPTGDAKPASASGGAAGEGNGYKGDDTVDTSDLINSRAYLITLVKVPNTAGLTSGYEAALKADNTLTQVAYSTADQYLSTYPSCFSTATIRNTGLSDYALVLLETYRPDADSNNE